MPDEMVLPLNRGGGGNSASIMPASSIRLRLSRQAAQARGVREEVRSAVSLILGTRGQVNRVRLVFKVNDPTRKGYGEGLGASNYPARA